MNHYALAMPSTLAGLPTINKARYGSHAIPELIDKMVALGATRSRLVAKVFGGARMLEGTSTSTISEDNIAFAISYLEEQEIPIIASDVGGMKSRRLTFNTEKGTVRVDWNDHRTGYTPIPHQSLPATPQNGSIANTDRPARNHFNK